jgi:hypothetical protein
MWNTKIVNSTALAMIANGVAMDKNSTRSFDYLATGIHVQIPGVGVVQALASALEHPELVMPTRAVLLLSGGYTGLWGYEGHPEMTLTLHPDFTFSAGKGIEHIPIQYDQLVAYPIHKGKPLANQWRITPNPNGLAATPDDGYLHYEASNLGAENQWLKVVLNHPLAAAQP